MCATYHEDIASIWQVAAHTEQFKKIVKLAVDIATHSHRAGYRLNIALFHHDVAHLLAESLHVLLGQVLAFAQLGNPGIWVTHRHFW